MKYWQKIFLSTLVLFLASLNMGAYLLFQAAYRTSLNSERERSFSEHELICSVLGGDIASIQSREEPADDDVWSSLFQRYAQYYKSKGIFLAVHNTNGSTYSNIPPGITAPKIPDDRSKASVIATIDAAPYLFVSGRIEETGFDLVTARSVKTMQASADDLSRMLTLGSALMSVVLAAALFLMLKGLTRPIKKLADAASAIAGGDYSVSANIYGRDEIAELASRFFAMARTIETQICELKLEAERKQSFIDGLAHEMRTPLAAIGGYAQYLCEAAIDEEERLSACAYISRESARLADLSEKLLMLTKVRHASPNITCVRLTDLFADIQRALPDSEIMIHFDANDAVWQTDGTLLNMLLTNLINNAIQACGERGKISVTADEKKIAIADNGCGISEDALAHLTEPFYRADKSRSRRGGGTGLGLSICESICGCLRLHMHIESEEGKGTKVLVLQLDNDSETNC